jgi:hypothetical protein
MDGFEASVVAGVETTTMGVVELWMGATVAELEATTEAGAAEEVPKFELAVTLVPLLTVTSLTITMSPLIAVTLISTVDPAPLEISKKLYVCLVVGNQVDPPLELTSRVETAWLAFTTCMLNQYAETPSLL